MSREKDWSEEVMCTTFGAPFVGNDVLGDEVERLQWQNAFLHVVNRHDIVPRLLLSKAESAPSANQMPFSSGACRAVQLQARTRIRRAFRVHALLLEMQALNHWLLSARDTPTVAPHLVDSGCGFCLASASH